MIRIAIVDDDRATREGLAALIDSSAGFRCIGSFRSAEEALEKLADTGADVVLLDVHMPGLLGSDAARLFRDALPSAQIVMLSVYSDDDIVFQSICNGASGYLLKKTPPDRLLESIREAHEGGAPMSPEVARKVVTLFRRVAPVAASEGGDHLTPREAEVLRLLADGHAYESAGRQLNVSVNTVRNYVRSIYEKLHVHSKSEAVSKAIRNRIIG